MSTPAVCGPIKSASLRLLFRLLIRRAGVVHRKPGSQSSRGPFARLELAQRHTNGGLGETVLWHRNRFGPGPGVDRLGDIALQTHVLDVAVARPHPLERRV